MHYSTLAFLVLFCAFRASAAWPSPQWHRPQWHLPQWHLPPVHSPTSPTIPASTDQGEQMKKAVDGMVESSQRGKKSGKIAAQAAQQGNWGYAQVMAEDSVRNFQETERKTRDAMGIVGTLPEEGRARAQEYFNDEERQVSSSLACAQTLLVSIKRRQQPVAPCLHLHPAPEPQQPAPVPAPQNAPPQWPATQKTSMSPLWPAQQRGPAVPAPQNAPPQWPATQKTSMSPLWPAQQRGPAATQALFSASSKDVVPTNRAWQHAVPFVFTTFGLVALFTAGLAVARHRRHSMAGPLEAHSELMTEASLKAAD